MQFVLGHTSKVLM